MPASTSGRGSEQAAGILLIRLSVLAGLLGGLTRTLADPDLWGHIRFGADILERGLSTVDPYSFTSNVPWVNHEWLAEVLMFGAWHGAGNTGLILLKLAIVSATLGAVLHTLRRDLLPSLTRDLLTFVVIVALWPRAFVVRPQLFSVVLFTVLLWVLRSVDRGHTRRVWLAPVLMACWVNLHGGWIVGVGALLLWIAATLASSREAQRSWKPLLACGVVTLAATLANPYDVQLWTFLARTVGMERPNISDWRPLFESGADVILPWTLTACAAVAGLWRAGWKVPPAHALIVLGLAAASIRVNRLDIFFTLSTVMLLGPWLADARSAVAQERPLWTGKTISGAAAVVLAMVVATWRFGAAAGCVRLDGPWIPDREAAMVIKESDLHGRLLTWFDWGQYAIWHFSPGLRVSLDGRRETVYSEAFVARHINLYFRPEMEAALLTELAADYAWLPKGLPLSDALDRAGWHRFYTGRSSIVFARERPGIQASRLLSAGCFPGP